jgi:plasmid stabilization system protein ParE
MASIESAIAYAVERPSQMRPRTDLGSGIFAVRCVSHIAFLKQKDGRWLVIAVLHQRMDIARHFRALRDD